MRAVLFLAMLAMSSSASRRDASDKVPVLKRSQREGGDTFQEAEKRWSLYGETENVVSVKNQYETRNMSQEADERRANDEDAVKDVRVKHRMSIACAEKSYSKYPCYRGYRYGCSGYFSKECWKTVRAASTHIDEDYYYFENENRQTNVKCSKNRDCLAHWKALEAEVPLDEPCAYKAYLDRYPCRYGHRYGCVRSERPARCWITTNQADIADIWYVKDRLKKSCNNNEQCDPAAMRSRDKCGKRKVSSRRANRKPGTPRPMRMRIVGGNHTVRGYIPWQVIVLDSSGLCGGTIIGRKWILTARHCVVNEVTRIPLDASDFTVKAGKIDMDNVEDGEQTVSVEKIFPYPPDAAFDQSVDDLIRRYHPWPDTLHGRDEHHERELLDLDVALLQLSEELRFDDYTQPACLPSPANEVADYALGNRVIISGWGVITPKGAPSRFLQVAKLPIINHTYCNEAPTWKFCAAHSVVGGAGICDGDSGGPVVKRVGGRFTVLGVIESSDCSEPSIATSIFAKVSYYVDWIKQTVRDNYDYLDNYNKKRTSCMLHGTAAMSYRRIPLLCLRNTGTGTGPS